MLFVTVLEKNCTKKKETSPRSNRNSGGETTGVSHTEQTYLFHFPMTTSEWLENVSDLNLIQ